VADGIPARRVERHEQDRRAAGGRRVPRLAGAAARERAPDRKNPEDPNLTNPVDPKNLENAANREAAANLENAVNLVSVQGPASPRRR
jgi:hypothetical protein